VHEALLEYGTNVVIAQTVVRLFPRSAGADEVRLSEYSELVGDRRLLHEEHARKLVHAQLATHQSLENAQPGGISEHFVEIGEIGERVVVHDASRFSAPGPLLAAMR
jgi:hypothetical protein